MAERDCHICGTHCGENEACPKCTVDIPNRADPATMTADQRVAEIRELWGPLEVDWPIQHARIEGVVGRPVWTHELGLRSQEEFEEMARDRTCEKPDILDIVSLIPPDKETFIVAVGDLTEEDAT